MAIGLPEVAETCHARNTLCFSDLSRDSGLISSFKWFEADWAAPEIGRYIPNTGEVWIRTLGERHKAILAAEGSRVNTRRAEAIAGKQFLDIFVPRQVRLEGFRSASQRKCLGAELQGKQAAGRRSTWPSRIRLASPRSGLAWAMQDQAVPRCNCA
jgi:hypothetical protein